MAAHKELEKTLTRCLLLQESNLGDGRVLGQLGRSPVLQRPLGTEALQRSRHILEYV